MKKNEVLYQIKSLDKKIIRYFIQNCAKNTFSFSHTPTPTQIEILAYLMEHQEENIYQRDLESILHLRRATVSGVLKTMEKNKLIERTVPKYDGRIKKITLTENAKLFFEENKRKLSSLNEIISCGITKEELEIFSRVVEKMEQNVENSLKESCFSKKGVDD